VVAWWVRRVGEVGGRWFSPFRLISDMGGKVRRVGEVGGRLFSVIRLSRLIPGSSFPRRSVELKIAIPTIRYAHEQNNRVTRPNFYLLFSGEMLHRIGVAVRNPHKHVNTVFVPLNPVF
jgi:hypothetical protein